MIQSIIAFSVRNKLWVALMTAALVIGGLWSIGRVPTDALPDITNNQVQIISQAPNLSTEDIEQFITYPVELGVANLPGVVEIRSISRFGLSTVTVVFEEDMGTFLPRQLVAERLDQIRQEIPEGLAVPQMGPITTGLGEILQYVLEVDSAYKDKYSLTELRSIQDWIVRRQMAMTPGVIEVNAFGGQVKQYEIAINPNTLKASGVSILEIFTALKANNQNTGSAYIEKDHMANYIRGEGLMRDIKDIRSTLVKNINGMPITIGDVADVQIGSDVRYGAFTKNGEGEAVGGIILMMKGENSNKVIGNVKDRMAEIQKSLPEGVSIQPFLDRSKLIQNTTKTVTTNLTEGALIVIFVLVFLLGNWRGGLIVASVIPLSLLFAFILMNAFDVWSNLMSLGAIDFGIIVDGAVIIVEGAVFLFHNKVVKNHLPSQEERDEDTIKSSSGMMKAAFFGQLIILIVFIPILSLEGIEGKMFRPMALTFILAMLGVMLLCLTYVPMMTAWFLRVKTSEKKSIGDRFILWLEDRYQALMLAAFKRSYLVISLAVVLLVTSIYTFSRMGGEFIPKLDEGDIAFHDLLRPGSSLSEGIEVTTKVEKTILENFPEAEQVLSRIGVSEVPIDLMPMDAADCFIILKPKEEWVSAETKEELIEKIKAKLQEIPGVNYEFTQPIEMRFNELMTGIREDLAIKIYGEDLNVLASKAREVMTLINGIEGIGDMKLDQITGMPQITIEYKRNKLAQYGLTAEDVNRLIETSVAGLKAGVIYELERRYDLVIRVQEAYRRNMQDLENLFLTLPNGEMIPLSTVAELNYRTAPMQIGRDNTNRRTYVGVNVRGRDIQSLVEEISVVLDENLELPPGYFIRYGGAFENLQRATKRLQIVVPIALALIFILIFFALGSMRQTLMIYIAIPLAAIGGVFSLYLRDMPFSISAGIGFIVLFGIAVLNGLVLISSWNELKKEGVDNIKDRIISGARRRVRPILLTASTDILGFLPMAISTTAGAEVQRPLATVVIGGMITATLLILFVLPILYQWTESSRIKVPKPGMAVLIIALMALPFSGQAQELNTVDQAISIAETNNRSLLASEENIKAEEALANKKLDLNKTNVSFQYGQYDGLETDFAFQVNQSFAFPTFYIRQNQLGNEKVRARQIESDIGRNQIIRNIKLQWFNLAILHEKLIYLEKQDSLLERYLKGTEARYELEDATILEKMTVESRVMENKNQIEFTQADIQISKDKLLTFIDDSIVYTVNPKTFKYNKLNTGNTDVNIPNPVIFRSQQEVSMAQSRVRLENARMLPGFQIGYFNSSFIGSSLGDGNSATMSDRFDGIQAGISIPIFYQTHRSKIRYEKFRANMAQLEAEYVEEVIMSRYREQVQELDKYSSSLSYYETKAIPQADKIISNAQIRFENEDIGYLEFLQSLTEAYRLKLNYLETLDLYNKAAIELEYLKGGI